MPISWRSYRLYIVEADKQREEWDHDISSTSILRNFISGASFKCSSKKVYMTLNGTRIFAKFMAVIQTLHCRSRQAKRKVVPQHCKKRSFFLEEHLSTFNQNICGIEQNWDFCRFHGSHYTEVDEQVKE